MSGRRKTAPDIGDRVSLCWPFDAFLRMHFSRNAWRFCSYILCQRFLIPIRVPCQIVGGTLKIGMFLGGRIFSAHYFSSDHSRLVVNWDIKWMRITEDGALCFSYSWNTNKVGCQLWLLCDRQADHMYVSPTKHHFRTAFDREEKPFTSL